MHPTYLARVELDPRDREAAKLASNPHWMHGFVEAAVAIDRQGAPRWLYHLSTSRGVTQLLVQSPVPTRWDHAPHGCIAALEQKEITAFLEGVDTGMVYDFALTAGPRRRNTTARIAEGAPREEPLRTDEERLAWLERSLHGAAELLAADVVRVTRSTAELPSGRLPVGHTEFLGTLRVVSRLKLQGAIVDGLGPQKAYGNGLLRIQRH